MFIEFETLEYSNFLSTGATPTLIDFRKSPSTLVVGTNGSGKSSVLDALSFALFNKPHRAINKPQLVNSINKKNLMTIITFSIGKKRYIIKRGLRPNIFEIWVDGALLNQESHARDYQKLLETNILKLNHKSFHQVVVLGSSNFVPFMQLRPGDRRMIIEDLLDISIFSKMNALLKESSNKLKDIVKDAEHRRALLKAKIEMQRKHIAKLESLSKSSVDKTKAEIRELTEERDVLLESNTKSQAIHDENIEMVNSKLSAVNVKLKKLESYDAQIKTKIKTIASDEEFYNENDICPSCAQNICESVRTTKLKEFGQAKDKLTEGSSALATNMKSVQAEQVEFNIAFRKLQTMMADIRTNQTLIDRFNTKINSLHSDDGGDQIETDLKSAAVDILDMHSARDNIGDELEEYSEAQHYNGVIYELLKDTGIKTKIIKQYLPVMNKLINNYLHVLDFFVSFELDEAFNETLRSRHRDNFSYSSFSEGEKSRIDLALLFSWRQIAKMKNSANTNLLILDEVFDASLDADGVDNLLRILETLDAETKVFVISHKQDLLESKFESKLEFSKIGNFTSITET